MWIRLRNNYARLQTINMDCIGRIKVEKSKNGFVLKCEMSSIPSLGPLTITLGCYPTADIAEDILNDILNHYKVGTKIYDL